MKRHAICYCFAAIAALSASCSSSESKKQPTAKQIAILNSSFNSSVAIFLPEGNLAEQVAVDTLSKFLPQFNLVTSLPDSISGDGYLVRMKVAGDHDFFTPDTSMVYVKKYLNFDELIALQKTTRAIDITFFGTSANVIEKQLAISRAVAALTAGKQVIIADINTMQFYSTGEWVNDDYRP